MFEIDSCLLGIDFFIFLMLNLSKYKDIEDYPFGEDLFSVVNNLSQINLSVIKLCNRKKNGF